MNIFGKCLIALLKQKNKLPGGKLIFMQANKAKTVPNQKVIEERKMEPLISGKFSSVANTSSFYAMRNLSGNAYKAWTYFLTFNPKSEWSLSKADMTFKCNFSDTTYRNVIKELTEKGFLEQGKKKNGFIFIELPKKEEELSGKNGEFIF